jgi:hypothetical protein
MNLNMMIYTPEIPHPVSVHETKESQRRPTPHAVALLAHTLLTWPRYRDESRQPGVGACRRARDQFGLPFASCARQDGPTVPHTNSACFHAPLGAALVQF